MLFILHQTNCQNAFGSGFAGYLNSVSPLPKQAYHRYMNKCIALGSNAIALGTICEVPLNDNITIVHVFGQLFYGNSRKTNKCYTIYHKVDAALAEFRRRHPNDTAICPVNMGCGLAGGDWNRYSAILAKYNIQPQAKINLKAIGSSEPVVNPPVNKPMEFRGDYWFLSNFYPCPIHCNGLEFTCVEAAFQATKCADPADRKKFVGLKGAEAKKLGRKIKMRHDWDKVKVEAMAHLIAQKFNQFPELMEQLKAIKTPIVENNTWGDTFWGVCNGKGENVLGKILMATRDGLQLDPTTGWYVNPVEPTPTNPSVLDGFETLPEAEPGFGF